MKKTIVIAMTLTILSACKKNSNSATNTPAAYTPDCSGTTPTFSATVSSLITSACASSGCHTMGSNSGPGALTTYAQISGAASSIRASIIKGSMPQGSTLTTSQKNNIICWIDAGAKNN